MRHQSTQLNALLPRSAATRLAGRVLMILVVAASTLLPATKAAAAPATVSSDPAALLRAIAEVETGNNPRKIGRHGERGLYQMRHVVWRRYTKRAFCDAHIPSTSREIATQHVAYLEAELRRAGLEPTPYLVAAAWNSGLSSVLNNRVPASTRNYAERVTNLTTVFAVEMAPRRIVANSGVMIAAQ